MKRRWRALHRPLGLLLGLWLAWLGLTGSLLALATPWEEFWHRDLYRVHPRLVRAPLQECRRAAQSVHPTLALERIDFPARPAGSYRFQFEGGRLVMVDPGTAAVLGTRLVSETLKGRVLPLHELGEPLLWVVALAGLVLLGTGWKLQPPTRHALALGPRRHPFDLHRWVGWVATPWLAMAFATGAMLTEYKHVDSFLRGFAARPPAPKATPAPVGDLDELLGQARAIFPQAVVVRLHLPKQPDQPVEVRLRQPGEKNPVGRSYVYLDPSSGLLLGLDDALAEPTGVRWLHGAYWLHAGFFPGGGPLLFWLGLAPLTLWWLGLRMRRKRLSAQSFVTE